MKQNPYVGPRPYERADRARFYGREHEAQELQALIAAEKELLVYSQSGAGKTSLFNARVVPALEEQGFRVLPVARVGLDLPAGILPGEVDNIFIFSALLALAGATAEARALLGQDLSGYLQGQVEQPLSMAAGPGDGSTQAEAGDFAPGSVLEPDLVRPLVLVFDQFEELFTAHRQRWEEEKGFFAQVCAAMQAIPSMAVVFVMREDHLAELDPYLDFFPNRLRSRFRLERLGQRAALAAITRPAADSGLPFAPGVAEKLVDDLRRVKVQLGSGQEGSAPGPFVEPVQLQVVCSRLWANLPEGKTAPIGWEEVAQFGDVDRALVGFYEQAVQAAAGLCGLPERAVRRWFGRELITPVGTRGLVLEGPGETAGLPNSAVELLEELHIVSAEVRAGARWYELSHDRLIDSILKSNLAWEQRNETPLRAATRQWQESGDKNLLYRGKQLAEARLALSARPEDFDPAERSFLETSAAVEHRSRSRALIAGLLLAALLFVGLAALTFWSLRNAQWAADAAQKAAEARLLAEQRLTTAETQRQEIARQITLNRARELALASVNAQSMNRPQLGALLALQSIALYHTVDEQGAFPAGEQVLRDSLGRISGQPLNDSGLFTAFTVSPDGQWAAMATRSGSILVRSIADPYRVSDAGILPSGGPAYTLEFSQDGRFLLWGGDAGQAYLSEWQKEPGAPVLLQLPDQDHLHETRLSPDGAWAALSDEGGSLYLWRLSNGKPSGQPLLLFRAAREIPVPVFRPGGEWLAVQDPSTARITFWKLGEAQPEKPTVVLDEIFSGPAAIAFSPDGSWMAVSEPEYYLSVFDLEDGISAGLQPREKFKPEPFETFTDALAFRADNCVLVAGSTKSARVVWLDRAKAPTLVDLFEMEGGVGAVAVQENSVIIGKNDHRVLVQEAYLSAQSPTGCEYRPPSDDQMKVQDWASQYVLTGLEGPPRLIRFTRSQAGLVAATQDGEARLWRFDPLELSAYPYWLSRDSSTDSAAFSPDRRWIAIGSRHGVFLFPSENIYSAPVRLEPPVYINAIAFSHNGRWVAAGTTEEHRIYLWDLEDIASGSRVSLPAAQKEGQDSGPGYRLTQGIITFSPDDRWVVYNEYGSAQKSLAWKLDDAGRPVEAIELPYNQLDFSPDGAFAAAITVGEQENRTVFVFRMEGEQPFSDPGQAVVQLEFPDFVSIGFDPAGKALYIGHDHLSETILLLDIAALKTGEKVIKTVQGLEGMQGILPDPTGKDLFTFSMDGLLLSLDVDRILASSADTISARAVEKYRLETGSYISSIAASPDGRLLAVSSPGSAIRLWERADPQAAPLLLQVPDDEIAALVFAPDSRSLIFLSRDRGAAVWKFMLDDLIRLACDLTRRELTAAEAQEYLPGEQPLPVCPAPAP